MDRSEVVVFILIGVGIGFLIMGAFLFGLPVCEYKEQTLCKGWKIVSRDDLPEKPKVEYKTFRIEKAYKTKMECLEWKETGELVNCREFDVDSNVSGKLTHTIKCDHKKVCIKEHEVKERI